MQGRGRTDKVRRSMCVTDLLSHSSPQLHCFVTVAVVLLGSEFELGSVKPFVRVCRFAYCSESEIRSEFH